LLQALLWLLLPLLLLPDGLRRRSVHRHAWSQR
jgi:hypothetical protein